MKKFSLICTEDMDLWCCGYKEADDVVEIDEFANEMLNISEYCKVKVEVYHCLLRDFEGKPEDISQEELNKLVDLYDALVECGYIECEEVLEFEVYGLKQEEVVSDEF